MKKRDNYGYNTSLLLHSALSEKLGSYGQLVEQAKPLPESELVIAQLSGSWSAFREDFSP